MPTIRPYLNHASYADTRLVKKQEAFKLGAKSSDGDSNGNTMGYNDLKVT